MKPFLLLTALLQFQWQALSVENQFESPTNIMCACPGEVLTYICTVDGGNATTWGGSAFDCAGNEIVLRHDNFIGGTSGECNDGAILGKSGDVDKTYLIYTSQLNITVSNGLNDKTVTCSSDSKTYNKIIWESRIKVPVGSAPDNIYLIEAQKGKLLFSWTPVALNDCSGLKYSITSDCGTCLTVTNRTTTTCSELQLTTNTRLCHFRVSSVVCGLAGNPSLQVAVKLKVPNAPQVEVVPSYSNDSQALQALFIVMTVNQTEDFFTISGNISGSPTNYTTHVSNLFGSSSFDYIIDLSSCEEGYRSGCLIELPDSSYCPQLTIISVTVSAANKLGEGPHSNPFMIECTNNFVRVEYSETTVTVTPKVIISCTFLNPSDTSEKTCCISHRLCDQLESRPQNVRECNDDIPYRIELEVPSHSGERYCYTVTASNDTHTVKVEGSFIAGFDHLGSITAAPVTINIVLPAVSGLIALMIVCTVLSLVTKYIFKRCGGGHQQHNDEEDAVPLKQYLTQYYLPVKMKKHEVGRDCELRHYVTKTINVDSKLRRGHAYYEFANEVENIQESKKILFQDKHNTTKWFTFKVEPKVLAEKGLYGERIPRKRFGERYRIFIQSFGSGARHLPRHSYILYDESKNQVHPDVLPLVPVCSEHFAHKVIDEEEGCTVQHFCTQNRLNPKAFNIFLSADYLPKEMRDQPPRDVILKNKESKLYTGPFARQMLGPNNEGKPQLQHKEWNAFVLPKKIKKDLVLKKGSEVLYQDSQYLNGKYRVLTVDKDHVRMSKFIEKKLKCQFVDRKAFYEAESEEDLLYYKKILRPKKEELSCEWLELQSPVEYFYANSRVPSNAVKLEDLRHRRIFIQSTSQGSRCLKKGAKLIYLIKYINCNDRELQIDPDEASNADSNAAEDDHCCLHQ